MTGRGEPGAERNGAGPAEENKETGGLGVMYGHRYTEKERGFLSAYVPGHSHREIQEAFTERFGWEISLGQIKSYIGNHHLNTGRTGQFEKGHVPANKGKKETCAAGCEKTWFRKGHVPGNHRPVGSERINVDGYIEIKVAEPNKWRLKHRVVWESAHGEIPKGHVVIFRDNDSTNTEINNLMLVKRGTHAVMNKEGLCRYTGEFKETAALAAELQVAARRKCSRRKDIKNGAEKI